MILAFDDFEYDRECRELRQSGMMLPVEPQVFDLLGFLIDERDRVVSKDEIIDSVWQGRIVSDAAVSSRVMAARKALGDDGRRQTFIKTVHGTGFRFVGEVNSVEDSAIPAPEPAPVKAGLNTIEEHPHTSLIVLPFRCLDCEPSSEILADAVHEDLTTQLSRMRDYVVISRGAAILNSGAADTPELVGRALGVGYVITGAVRPSGDMIRITAQVIESKTGRMVTALTFDRKRTELLDLQNTLILQIANSLGTEIDIAEVRRLEVDARRDPSAHFHFKSSATLLDQQGWNRSSVSRVIGHLETARKVDPDFAPAIAMLALIKGLVAPWGLIDKTADEVRPEVIALADEAIEKDPYRPAVLGWAGCAYCDAGLPEKGKPYLERAVQLDPSNSQAHSALGWAHILLEDYDTGIEFFRTAIQISPNYPGHAIWLYGMSLGYAAKKDAENEQRILEEAIKLDPKFAPPYVSLSRLAEYAGDQEAADAYKQRAKELLAE
ncbi:MAG: winged helix-turn-helix domain-containing protein [Pseudomonadota bacterium]